MEPKKLSLEEQLEYIAFFNAAIKSLQSDGEVSTDLVREMRNRIASLLRSDAFTRGERDDLADMCILLHQSLAG
jgi:hypothetical protein